MKFGLFGGARARGGPAGDSHAYHDFVNYVIEAEKLGFSSVFRVEHHFTGFGQVSASMSLLAYLAARTERIRLGTAVVVLPWLQPSTCCRTAVWISGSARAIGATNSPASASRPRRRPSGSTRRWT